jgi:hypothetical protein
MGEIHDQEVPSRHDPHESEGIQRSGHDQYRRSFFTLSAAVKGHSWCYARALYTILEFGVFFISKISVLALLWGLQWTFSERGIAHQFG